MSVIRVIVIDPDSKPGEDDALVFQVPESSRQLKLLLRVFSESKLEHVVMEPSKRSGGPRRKS